MLVSVGSLGGLRLEINPEQYEYMFGPHVGSGIKLLLHDPEDVALTRSMGISVMSGGHAFVGVQMSEVRLCSWFSLSSTYTKFSNNILLS